MMQMLEQEQNNSLLCIFHQSCALPAGPEIECAGDSFTVTLLTDEDYSKVTEYQTMLVTFKQKIRDLLNKNPALMGLFIPP